MTMRDKKTVTDTVTYNKEVVTMLSPLLISRLKKTEKRKDYPDSDGLFLRVTPTGLKSWYVRYWKNGKDTIKKIGEFPLMSLGDARTARDTLKQRIRAGLPAEDKSGLTFSEVAAEWVPIFTREKSEKHVATITYRLDHYITPAIGKYQLTQLSRQVLTGFLMEIAARGHVETAQRSAAIVQRILDFAVFRGYIDNHNGHKLTSMLPTKAPKHFTHITEQDEMGRLLHALASATSAPTVKTAAYCLVYCFPRVGELLLSTWQEIDLDGAMWRLPAEHTKLKREHLIPLPRQIVQRLKVLREYLREERYKTDDMNRLLVFPSIRPMEDQTAIREASILKLFKTLHKEDASVPVTTCHGFRHSASTFLHRAGENTLVVEKQLAHLDPNKIRAIYNSYEYLDERRAMLQRYADMLDSLEMKEKKKRTEEK